MDDPLAQAQRHAILRIVVDFFSPPRICGFQFRSRELISKSVYPKVAQAPAGGEYSVRGTIMALVDPVLLEILVCPETKQPVKLADEALVQKLNTAAQEGKLKYRSGEAVDEKFDGGLIREDGKYLYPIVDGISVMLIDKGIPLDQDLE